VDWHCLTNISALIVGPEEPRFLCPRCSAEYNHFLEHALEGVPDGLPESAQLARFQTLRAEAHEYMLKWVTKTKA
jgi:hypothetical protein